MQTLETTKDSLIARKKQLSRLREHLVVAWLDRHPEVTIQRIEQKVRLCEALLRAEDSVNAYDSAKSAYDLTNAHDVLNHVKFIKRRPKTHSRTHPINRQTPELTAI